MNNNQTEYAGIDYGLGSANCDKENGIRFGVIAQNSCDPEALDWSGGFENASDAAYKAAYDEALAEAKAEFEREHENVPEDEKPEFDEDDFSNMFGEVSTLEDTGFLIKNEDGYTITNCLSYYLMIIKSPYFTFAQFCSPCVPGAGNLDSPCANGPKTYCLGHDWFENDIAPYPVYSVETGELVQPEAK